MKFLYNQNAGLNELEIKGDDFKHLKVRRVKVNDILEVRNMLDFKAYKYKITQLNRVAILSLISHEALPKQDFWLELAWSVIDEKEIEKTLPILNELGVKTIFFVYSDFSQKNIKLDFKRFERILISSSQQCGRNDIINLQILQNTKELLNLGKNVILLDFVNDKLGTKIAKDDILFIGPEGGFSQKEREIFCNKIGLKSTNTLRSVTAVMSVAAKLLS